MKTTAAFFSGFVLSVATAFSPHVPFFEIRAGGSSPTSRQMNEIADGVEFDTIAREWRCKWSPEGDNISLVAAQIAIETVIDDVKSVDGVLRVDRVVCGGCQDLKIVTSLPAEKFGDWKKTKFFPEEEFLDMLRAIKGISQIETQTYTLMSL